MKKILAIVLLLANSVLSQVCYAEFVDSNAKDQAEAIASANAKIQNIQMLVGQSFYAYFPRLSCQDKNYEIKSQPTFYDAPIYTSNTPQRVLVDEVVIDTLAIESSPLHYYYRLKLEDGTIGYVVVDYFKGRIGDPDSSYSLKKDCWFLLNPQELQSRLEKIESDRLAMEKAKAEKQKLEMEEKQRLADDAIQEDLARRQELQKNAPVILRKMSKDDFCVAYGNAVRDEEIYEIGQFPGLTKLVKLEARRRKLAFNDSIIQKEKIKIGMTECQLYAAWGSPSERNRSVGTWGVHIQHVYSGSYVYTENGSVTSWQN